MEGAGEGREAVNRLTGALKLQLNWWFPRQCWFEFSHFDGWRFMADALRWLASVKVQNCCCIFPIRFRFDVGRMMECGWWHGNFFAGGWLKLRWRPAEDWNSWNAPPPSPALQPLQQQQWWLNNNQQQHCGTCQRGARSRRTEKRGSWCPRRNPCRLSSLLTLLTLSTWQVPFIGFMAPKKQTARKKKERKRRRERDGEVNPLDLTAIIITALVKAIRCPLLPECHLLTDVTISRLIVPHRSSFSSSSSSRWVLSHSMLLSMLLSTLLWYLWFVCIIDSIHYCIDGFDDCFTVDFTFWFRCNFQYYLNATKMLLLIQTECYLDNNWNI